MRSAYQLAHHDIVLSHFSLARDHPVEHRIELAARNGCAGIGLYVGQYAALERAGSAPGELRDLLERHDLCLAEIEVVPGLGGDGPGGERAAAAEAVAWRMADSFGCRSLQVIGPAGADRPAAARAFGALCDRAADHGLVVALEFLPFTDIVSVHDAAAIVDGADRVNGGICVDIWHHERGAADLAAIAALPRELVAAIQVSDGPVNPDEPDYYTDCLAHRRPPGDGEFDLAGFVAALAGTRPPWGLEVCSTSGWADPEAHVARSVAGLRQYVPDG